MNGISHIFVALLDLWFAVNGSLSMCRPLATPSFEAPVLEHFKKVNGENGFDPLQTNPP